MNKSEILAFINKHKRVCVTTVEGDTPHVRRSRIHRIDNNGIMLQTFKHKPLWEQMHKNPKVELVFDDYQESGEQISKCIEIRVSGTVEFLDETKLSDEILGIRHTIKDWVENTGIEIGVYLLRNGVASVWTLDNEFEPKSYVQL